MRQAAALLAFVDGDAPSRNALAKAVREVWLASAESARWPPGPRTDAQRLVSLAFRDGALRSTVGRLTDDEAGEVIALVRRVADDVERSRDAP